MQRYLEHKPTCNVPAKKQKSHKYAYADHAASCGY